MSRQVVRYNGARTSGEVPERLNGTVSKTVVVLVATVGSNPTLSADWPNAARFFIDTGGETTPRAVVGGPAPRIIPVSCDFKSLFRFGDSRVCCP